MHKKTTLKNGLRVLTVPLKSTNAVTILVLVGTGSKYETKKINGISHFLEHMFFKGTTKRPTPLDIAEPVEGTGGVMNAFTGEDYTGYYLKVDSAQSELALDVVADIYLNSLLPTAEIKKEKGVVTEEINMYKDNPQAHVPEMWNELLYGDQPAGWNIAGSAKTVSSLTRKNLQDYVNSQYVASNTVICVSGDVKHENIVKQATKLFKGIRTNDFQQKEPVVERQTQPEVALEYRKTGQTHIALGVRGVSMKDERRIEQSILATLLGGMMSSRLFVQLRENLGAAYYVSTTADANPDTGAVVTVAGVTNETIEKAIKAILKEYKNMATTKLSAKELKKGKEYRIGRTVLSLESTDAKAEFYGMQELLQQHVVTPPQLYDKIQAVRASEIQKLAAEIFQPQNLNLVVLGPYKDKKPFQTLLKL